MDASRQIVGFVGADKPRFADETAALLRRRLKAVALILFIVLVAAFVGNFFLGAPLPALRVAVLVVFATSYFVLRSGITLSLHQLRLFELAEFGAVAVQLLMMMYLRIISAYGSASEDDLASAVGVKSMFLCAFCIMILTYGIFMPNTWKRATLVLVPVACLPYLALGILWWHVPIAAPAVRLIVSPIPLPFVATVVAVFGTHIINSVRRQEFRARQLGQYHLKEKIGVGGMGIVYEAEHCMLKRPCAIKLIKPENEADTIALARFEREVRSIAKLSHWNTVEIFDYGHAEDGTFYYVMELLPGLSLEDLIKRHGPMPAERTVHFLRQTCRALREAHAIGLIHRDIKPANIFAACRGGIYDVAKLLDFGLVKQSAGDSVENQSEKSTKGFSGSPSYMAPEQSIDYDKTDARGDIYALGAVGYFLLTGQPPFTGKNGFEILRAHHTRAVVPPSQLQPSVPADVEQVLLRCLAKAPDERYRTAQALENALASCQCADAWTDQQAAEWWSLYEPRQGAGRVSTSSTAGKTEAIIDATIDTRSRPG